MRSAWRFFHCVHILSGGLRFCLFCINTMLIVSLKVGAGTERAMLLGRMCLGLPSLAVGLILFFLPLEAIVIC